MEMWNMRHGGVRKACNRGAAYLMVIFWVQWSKGALYFPSLIQRDLAELVFFPDSIVVGCAPQMMPDFGVKIVCPSTYYSAGRTTIIEAGNVPMSPTHDVCNKFSHFRYRLFIAAIDV